MQYRRCRSRSENQEEITQISLSNVRVVKLLVNHWQCPYLTHSCLLSQMLYIGTMSHGEESRMMHVLKGFSKSKLTKRILPGDLFRDKYVWVQITMQEAYAPYISTLVYTFFLCSSMIGLHAIKIPETEWIATSEGNWFSVHVWRKCPWRREWWSLHDEAQSLLALRL